MKVDFSPLISGGSGSIGGVNFFSNKGQSIVRRRSFGRSRLSAGQQRYAKHLQGGVSIWHHFPRAIRSTLGSYMMDFVGAWGKVGEDQKRAAYSVWFEYWQSSLKTYGGSYNIPILPGDPSLSSLSNADFYQFSPGTLGVRLAIPPSVFPVQAAYLDIVYYIDLVDESTNYGERCVDLFYSINGWYNAGSTPTYGLPVRFGPDQPYRDLMVGAALLFTPSWPPNAPPAGFLSPVFSNFLTGTVRVHS